MSSKNISNSPASGGQPSTLQMMQKPSPPIVQSRPAPPIVAQPKTNEAGSSLLTYLLAGAASLVLIGGILYVGYELTKPTKKPRSSKITKGMEKVENKTKPESKVTDPIKTPGIAESDRHEVLLERKPNQDVGIFLCPGEDKQPGAFVSAHKSNKDMGLEIGAQLVEINGRVLNSEMSCKDVAQLLSKSCSPTGKLCFKKNPTLGERWQEAETTKESGNAHYKAKEYDASITKYSTAIEIHPTNVFYYSNKVNAMYSKAKVNPEQATEILSEALGLCDTMEELDVLGNFKKVYHLRGVILFELKRYEEAKKAFETYLEIDKTNDKIRARLEDCEKEIAAAVAAELAKDKEEVAVAGGDEKNQSPSPVLVEKPSPKEVEPLNDNEQQEKKIVESQEITGNEVIDDTSIAAPDLSEEKKDNTSKVPDAAADTTKAPDEGGKGSVEVQKD